jgi:Uncharacterised nucleotidyltransferase
MACSSFLDLVDAATSERTRALEHARLPIYARALLESLRFCDPDAQLLESLSEPEWKKLLNFADSSQLTLVLGKVCDSHLPDWVRARIDGNYCTAKKRFARLNAALLELADALKSSNIEFVLLKAHAHSPSFTPDPVLRAQGDIDLWCLPERVFEARNVLLGLGYLPQGVANGRHLAPFVRPTEWCWRGDYFAADLPIPVDLHYALWDAKEECIGGPAEQDLWNRREQMLIAGRELPVLCEADTLAFAALHLLMHLLGGDLRLQRAWEIARCIHAHADDDGFWRRWQLLHTARSRQVQVLVFRLCADWFASLWPRTLSHEEQNLRADVKLWIERYAMRPLESQFRPNKDELWLHLSLLTSRRRKLRVFTRRLVPIQLSPRPLESASGNVKLERTCERVLRWKFRACRFAHHLYTLLPTLGGALKWWWIRQRLESQCPR